MSWKNWLRARQAPGITIARGARVDRASTIGAHTYIGPRSTISRADIGNYVSVGANVTIGAGEHDLARLSTSALFYDDPLETLLSGRCSIRSDAWIGVNAVILRGAVVGIGAVIGATAVVTEDVPDFAIVAGAPARLIRYRFSEETRARLIASRWWDEVPSEARAILESIAREMG